MLGRLIRLISRRHGGLPDHRNRALEMAMDWDGDWHGPLGPRLRKELPHAAAEEIERVAIECAQALTFGHDVAFALCKAGMGTTANLEQEFQRQFRARYPWANEENVRRLLRQGLYYALKTEKAPNIEEPR